MHGAISRSLSSVVIAVWASAHLAAGFAPSLAPLGVSQSRSCSHGNVAGLAMQRIGSRGGVDQGFARQGSVTVDRGSRTLQREPYEGIEASRFWFNPFPLKPYNVERKTVVSKISNDIYSFEQEHGPLLSHPASGACILHPRIVDWC
jgi:hypothetical protein